MQKAYIQSCKKSLGKSLASYPAFHQDTSKNSTAEDVKPWRLVYQDPLRTWINGKFILVGDAAHPVHPIIGQGVNTSVEDAAALQVLLRDVQDLADLERRLKGFEDLRKPRTTVIQLLSTADPGDEASIRDQVDVYLEGKPSILNKKDSNDFIFKYV